MNIIGIIYYNLYILKQGRFLIDIDYLLNELVNNYCFKQRYNNQ